MLKIKLIDKIPSFFRDKYFLTILIFLLWLLFFDSNNLVGRIRDMRELRKLEADKEYYTERIAVEKQKLHELTTDNKNLEKFAREQYHMKRADEDLFVVLTPREDRQIARKNR